MRKGRLAGLTVLASLALASSLVGIVVRPNGIPELSGGTALPPVLDGVIGDEEWGGAASYQVTVNNRSVSIYVMNDAQNLYVAVKVITPNAGYERDAVRLEFDNDNDGDFYEVGNDQIQLYLSGEFVDYSRRATGGPIAAASDQNYGGTTDGGGGGHSTRNENSFEISHPLNSGDVLDIALSPGDVVGVQMSISENGGYAAIPYGAIRFRIKVSVPTYRLAVTVVDLLGARVQGVSVKIEGAGLPGGSQTATTNSSGQVNFYRLVSGTYTVSAEGASRTVQLTANGSTTLNVITSANWIIVAAGAVVVLAVAGFVILKARKRKIQGPSLAPPPPPPPV